MKTNLIKTIIFDYDGTLHDSFVIYKKAFLYSFSYLVSQKKLSNKVWKDDEIKAFLGKNPQDMWESFKPNLDAETIQYASQIISTSMIEQIESKQAKLYDGALEVLSYLKKKGYKLIYLSNSKTYYKEMNTKMFSLDLYFDKIICSHDYGFIRKIDIINKIQDELNKEIAVVGDRIYDIEIGLTFGYLTVGCDYGYGTSEELKDADIHIKDIKDLYQIF